MIDLGLYAWLDKDYSSPGIFLHEIKVLANYCSTCLNYVLNMVTASVYGFSLWWHTEWGIVGIYVTTKNIFITFSVFAHIVKRNGGKKYLVQSPYFLSDGGGGSIASLYKICRYICHRTCSYWAKYHLLRYVCAIGLISSYFM